MKTANKIALGILIATIIGTIITVKNCSYDREKDRQQNALLLLQYNREAEEVINEIHELYKNRETIIQKKIDNAFYLLDCAFHINEEDITTLTLYARLHYIIKDYDKCEDIVTLLLKKDENNFFGNLIFMKYLFSDEKYQAVIEHGEKALSNKLALYNKIYISDIHTMIGQAYHYLGNDKDSLSHFRLAHDNDEKDIKTTYDYGVSLYLNGHYQSAYSKLCSFSNKQPRGYEVKKYLAKCEVALGVIEKEEDFIQLERYFIPAGVTGFHVTTNDDEPSTWMSIER